MRIGLIQIEDAVFGSRVWYEDVSGGRDVYRQ